MKKKKTYIDPKPILEKKCRYNMLIGERSNGKSYLPLELHFRHWMETGKQLAIVRRWEEDFVGALSARTMYNSLMCNGNGDNAIRDISKGEYDGIEYYAGKYYLTQTDDESGKDKRTDKVIAFGFALNSAEHYKSGSYPNIDTIVFDEFIATKNYLVDEFVMFQNLLSTIIRDRDDVTIWMLGNTINLYCPYFAEMGLTRIKKMRPGDLDVYEYGASGLRVCVFYTDGPKQGKASDVYFAFNNSKLEMITHGTWQMDIYPHCPYKYLPKDIIMIFFIIFDNEIVQCEIIAHENDLWMFIHRKTTPIRNDNSDIVYSNQYSPKINYRRNLQRALLPFEKAIMNLFKSDKVFYQDNTVGELVRNYLEWCRKEITG